MSKLPSTSRGDTSALTSSDGLQLKMMNATVNFPEDVIAEILCCLPVKPLMRFKCVSKPWCSLIDSPHFVKAHLKRSIEWKTNTGIVIRGYDFGSVDFDSLDGATFAEIDEPLRTCLYGSAVVGACNGLLCLFNPKPEIFIWNPATRRCRKLTTAPVDFLRPFDFSQTSLCGFGYDALSDDYKVVRIAQAYGNDFSGSKVIVYSLKTNLWKRIENVSSHFRFSGVWGMFMAGALHWITVKTLGSKSCPTILALDLGSEKYKELRMPKLTNKNVMDMTIVIFGESICVLDYYHHIRIDVWMLKDYGVENSWSKLFSVEQPKVIRSFVSMRPVAYSKNRKDVLLEVDNKKVMWYNLERKKVKNVKINRMPDMFDLEVYTESLVKLGDDFNTDGKKVRKQPQEKKRQPRQEKNNERDKFLSKGFKLVL